MEQLLYAVDYEFHLPGMNFLGGGTKVTDRFSLNYGGTRGTKNYMIPTTFKDYVAMEHDLLYFAPESTVKKFADAQFLLASKKKTKIPFVEDLAILGQNILRHGYDLGDVAITGVIIFKQMKSLWNLMNKLGLMAQPASVQKLRMLQERLQGDLESRPQHAPAIYSLYNSIVEEIKNEPKVSYKTALYNTIFKFLPNLYILNFYAIPNAAKNIKNFYDKIKSSFIKNPDYEQIKSESDKVKDKYDSYLKEIGSWGKQVRGVEKFDVKDVNQINHNVAEKKYIEFYNQYKKYLEFINDKYKNDPTFKPYTIKELNMDNINLVKTPRQIPQAVYDDLANIYNDIKNKIKTKKEAIKEEEIKKRLRKEEEEEKRLRKEKLDEIDKVLKSEIDKPFETPVPEVDIPEGEQDPDVLEFEKPEEEKKVEIEKVLAGEIDIPFETPKQFDIEEVETIKPTELPIEIAEPVERTVEDHDVEALNHIYNIEVQPHYDYSIESVVNYLMDIDAM
jgi:hypothetical protein